MSVMTPPAPPLVPNVAELTAHASNSRLDYIKAGGVGAPDSSALAVASALLALTRAVIFVGEAVLFSARRGPRGETVETAPRVYSTCNNIACSVHGAVLEGIGHCPVCGLPRVPR